MTWALSYSSWLYQSLIHSQSIKPQVQPSHQPLKFVHSNSASETPPNQAPSQIPNPKTLILKKPEFGDAQLQFSSILHYKHDRYTLQRNAATKFKSIRRKPGWSPINRKANQLFFPATQNTQYGILIASFRINNKMSRSCWYKNQCRMTRPRSCTFFFIFLYHPQPTSLSN